MTSVLKFEVGSTYENMKGAYEVVSIHRDSMKIRWDDGSEAVTSPDLQQRIIERMALEKKAEAADEAANEKKIKKPRKKASVKAQPAKNVENTLSDSIV